ncbi:DUF6538 domain-containing protein [Mameliella alba]|uniref:DUF6538 domain-containing protein n=1 Tax=Mameliella alba TaxID=561184 RepID=UPI003AF31A33
MAGGMARHVFSWHLLPKGAQACPAISGGATYHLKRRVPTRYAKVERRTFIKMSLKTDSLGVARHKAEEVWDQLLAHSGRPCSRAI